MFGTLRRLSRILPALALAASACADEQPGVPPPRAQLYFPTGSALAEVDGRALLLVVSSNTDLRYDSGVLHAYDLAEIDALAEGATRPTCPEGVACSPGIDAGLDRALVDAVEIGSFGGDVAVAPLASGGLRAFVPVRAEGTVVAVDVTAEGLRCARAAGEVCVGPRFPRRDPFGVVAREGNVYVGHVGRDDDEDPEAVIGAAFVEAPLWTSGQGSFQLIGLGEEAVGGIAAGPCTGEGEAQVCTLYATGRSLVSDFNPVYLFDFRRDVLRAGPVYSRNVWGQQRGLDTRGVAVATGGETIYVASRFPAALASIDVSRIHTEPPPGCVIPRGSALPPEGCPERAPLDGELEPRFVTADVVAAPRGPNKPVVIPRNLPDGTVSDLVALTVEGGIAFYDMRTGVQAGAVTALGASPGSLAWRPHGTGIRLYVPVFGRGTLGVVDLPDLLRPASARVVALLGRQQEAAL